jgi:phage-related tail protein
MADAAGVRTIVEQEAEFLVAYQLDLLAQLERQLRAVHLTMRQIEKLRRAKARREGFSLSNGEKMDALDSLAEQLEAIDHELQTQHDSCREMLDTVETMRGRLRQLRQSSGRRVSRRQIEEGPPSTTRNRRKR